MPLVIMCLTGEKQQQTHLGHANTYDALSLCVYRKQTLMCVLVMAQYRVDEVWWCHTCTFPPAATQGTSICPIAVSCVKVAGKHRHVFAVFAL